MSVHIRLASVDDAAAILDIYRPIVRDTHISFEYVVPDEREIARRIQKTLAQYPWLVCELEGQLAAYAYGSAFRGRRAYQWTVETTVYVHGAFRRRGLARALYQALLSLLRAQGYCNALGVIALPNAASVAAHEALGFRKIGVFENAGYKAGAWHATGWWQLALQAMPKRPQDPIPIAGLAQAGHFPQLLAAGLPSISKRAR